MKYFKNEENRGNCSSNINPQLRCVRVGLPNSSSWMICSLIHIFTKIIHAYETTHCAIGVSVDLHTPVMEKGIHERMKVPRWTDMMLEGRNLLGNPSGVSFLTDKFEGFDEKLDLLLILTFIIECGIIKVNFSHILEGHFDIESGT